MNRSEVPHRPADPNATDPGARDAEFRCTVPLEILGLLCELRETAGPVVLSNDRGCAQRATLWTVDAGQQRLSFEVERSDPGLDELVGGNECTAVAYLQQIRLQFELFDLMLVHGPLGTALQARLPQALYRFQRRQTFRVEPLGRSSAVADLRHPSFADMRLSLRVLDISAEGCALQLPANVPPLALGIVLDGVDLRLGLNNRVRVRLRLQHATSMGAREDGIRLGCEFVALEADNQARLQRHIDQLQRERRLLATH